MKKNVGTIDKIIRIVLGIGIIGVGIYYGSWWGALGIIPLLTGIVGRCGFYSLSGIDTCKLK